MPFGRDVTDIDALVTDRYLDSLLAARDNVTGAPGAPGAPERGLELAVRLASDRLVRDLPRFHPSFRFEERLAVRLAEAAAAMRLPAAAGAEGSMSAIPFPAPEFPAGFDPYFGAPDGPADDAADDAADRAGRRQAVVGMVPRPLLIGGAVAASALSLAGAAIVAWRRSHPHGSPMARAARAAHAMRGRPVQG